MDPIKCAQVAQHVIDGGKVLCISPTMPQARTAFDSVLVACVELGADFKASKARLTIRCGEGSARFTSRSSQARGLAIDSLMVDELSELPEWAAPYTVVRKVV